MWTLTLHASRATTHGMACSGLPAVERDVTELWEEHERIDERQLARLKKSLGQAQQEVRPAQIERRQQCDAEEVGREPLEFGRGEWLELRLESLEGQARAVSGTQQSHLVARASEKC